MNKLMLVVTDGAPDETDWTRQSLVSARKAGIEVVTLFIGGAGATFLSSRMSANA